jgi:membrane-bound lytic murein transglycosylase D
VAGQPIKPTALASTTGGKAKKATKPKAKYHTVRSGQTLSHVAHKYKVRVSDLMRWNNIKSANKIRVGQKLKLYGTNKPTVKWTSYTVRRGDTLSTIARRHGCSTADLKKWNKLKSTKIMAGQKLKVQRK